jgi:hypothetical protein
MPSTQELASALRSFDPYSSDYDYKTAIANGMGGTGTGVNAGHWGSVAPAPQNYVDQYSLPAESYMMLKGVQHPTWHKAVLGEQQHITQNAPQGYEVVQYGDRFFSIPKK